MITFLVPVRCTLDGIPLEYHVNFCDKVDKRTREYKRKVKYIIYPWIMLKILSLDNITVKFYSLESNKKFRLIAKNAETAYKINKIIRGYYD